MTGNKHACKTVQCLDCAIDPRAVDFVARLVNRKPRLPIIQPAKYDIHSAENAETYVVNDVCNESLCTYIRVHLPGSFRSNLSLETANIFPAKKDSTGKICAFNAIHIANKDFSDSQQCKVFDQFISNGSGTDNHNRSLFQSVLIPPRNQTQPSIAVFFKILDS